MTTKFSCRHCGSPLNHTIIDLGHQPPSNAYLRREQLESPEVTYPLKLYICETCWLVQLPAHTSAEKLFTSDYAYFSSTSKSWCEHAERYVVEVVDRFSLGAHSHVVELASNDGYLLQFFQKRSIPCLGIEPTKATANAARLKGIETLEAFFTEEVSKELRKADLVIANNVMAHVPDINDFVSGIAGLLKADGRASIEFPHSLNLIHGNQFDTIYHEHYSYLSLASIERIAHQAGLRVVDVERLSTHGGSLRVWLAKGSSTDDCTERVEQVRSIERLNGLETLEAWEHLQGNAAEAKLELIRFLVSEKEAGRRILGYGAAAKGNTLLNYAGVKPDLLPMVADQALSKQGKFLPGSHIPICSPTELKEANPDSILILPWNLVDEIARSWPDRRLATAIPNLKIRG